MAALGSRRLWFAGGAVAVVAVVAVALVWWFGGSEPDEVDLGRTTDDDQAEEADDDQTEAADDTGSDDAGSDDSASEAESGAGASTDGTWTVDPDAVPFDREDGEGSFVGYRVDEELSSIGSSTAVGRTPAVEGEVRVEADEVTAAEIVADLTQLTSDEGRRDSRVRSTLSPDSEARFVLTDTASVTVPDAGDDPSEVSVSGELTIEGVTQEIEADVQVARRDEHVVIGGSAPILLSDFEVEPPSAPMVLSIADEATIEWQLYLAAESAPAEG